jgi:hypothetical protein
MCDYSLMMLDNRLAVEGEELVAHRFRSGTTGLLPLANFTTWQVRRCGFWQRLRDWFSSPFEPAPVVCVPPGARLRLHEFGACEQATFAQLSPESGLHRDFLLFDNGATVLLQRLPEGQRVTVLRLSSAEDVEPMAQPEFVGVA